MGRSLVAAASRCPAILPSARGPMLAAGLPLCGCTIRCGWDRHQIPAASPEAAEVLGLCDEVVRMAINAGQIPVTTIGRQRYIARGTLARIIAGERVAG